MDNYQSGDDAELTLPKETTPDVRLSLEVKAKWIAINYERLIKLNPNMRFLF